MRAGTIHVLLVLIMHRFFLEEQDLHRSAVCFCILLTETGQNMLVCLSACICALFFVLLCIFIRASLSLHAITELRSSQLSASFL